VPIHEFPRRWVYVPQLKEEIERATGVPVDDSFIGVTLTDKLYINHPSDYETIKRVVELHEPEVREGEWEPVRDLAKEIDDLEERVRRLEERLGS